VKQPATTAPTPKSQPAKPNAPSARNWKVSSNSEVSNGWEGYVSMAEGYIAAGGQVSDDELGALAGSTIVRVAFLLTPPYIMIKLH
jgi:hypothetical protein